MKALADRIAAAKLWLTGTSSIARTATTGAVGAATSALNAGAPRDLPYLAHALYALITVPTEQVPTLRADEHWRVYVNPGWAMEVTVPELGRELAHVTWHLLMEHASRARGIGVDAITADAWHTACDLTVHDTLAPEGCSPPGVGTTASTARADAPGPLAPGRPAEEYFATLSRLDVTPSASGASGRLRAPIGVGDGSTSDSPDGPGPDAGSSEGASGSPPGSQQGIGPNARLGPEEPVGPDGPPDACGSACDGIPRGTDLPPDADVGGVGKVQADGIRGQVAIEYLEAQKTRGTKPGEAMRWAKHVTEPEIAWESLLARATRRAIGWTSGRHSPTWTRPSRRQASQPDILQPGWRRPVPTVAIVVDTSASVDDRLLGKAMGEVEGALAGLGVRGGSVAVIACDASVGAVGRVRKATDAVLVGGGGTDMRVGIAAASALRPRPDLIVVFTDGYTPWPAAAPPGSLVIAAILGRLGETLPDTPPWATRIECTLRS